MIYVLLCGGLLCGPIAFSHHPDHRVLLAARLVSAIAFVLALLQWGAW